MSHRSQSVSVTAQSLGKKVTARHGSSKGAFVEQLTAQLMGVSEVLSVTFTGSFVDKEGLEGISDIDVVVITRRLTPPVLADCQRAAMSVSPALLGLPRHKLQLNDTFGPLKFDEPNVVMVHLMVYDIEGHRRHVLRSPFTCLDWERSPFHAGPSLREIYPVFTLQPRHFYEARRSVANYLSDLSKGSLSYRRYRVSSGAIEEVQEEQSLDPRHQGEYSYHIVRNLVSNYAKMHTGKNVQLAETEFFDFLRRHLPSCIGFISWFTELSKAKLARNTDFPADTISLAQGFLSAFEDAIYGAWLSGSRRHIFVRHAATAMNDGRFLGQRSDPPVLQYPAALESSIARVFTSSSRRCRESAIGLCPLIEPITDTRLNEIDYGAAEGLDYPALACLYPKLPEAWARGEDPRFPNGENSADVWRRLEAFLGSLPEENSLVVTHNVVLRCLLGRGLNLPPSQWHHIPVPHLDPIEILCLDGRWHLNLTREQLARIGDVFAAPVQ